MTRPSEASVVPIRLTLDGRSGVTLWATPWTEDDEEWQAFLGSGRKVLVFGSTAALVEYLRSGVENDLTEHPSWPTLRRLSADQLEPEQGYDFDLDGVYDLAAGDPDPFTVSTLSDVVDIVQRIAECCDDGTLLRLMEDTPTFATLLADDGDYGGPAGEQRWTDLGLTLDRSWELVLDRLGGLLEWRAAPPAEVEVEGEDVGAAEDEFAEASGNTAVDTEVETGGAVPAVPAAAVSEGVSGERARDGEQVGDAAETDPARIGPSGEHYSVWQIAGIVPIEVILPSGTGYTLRTYLGDDDEPVFLGSDLTVDLFRSPDSLAAYCRSDAEHDLSEMVTWPDIRDADPLLVTVEDDESYDLTGPSPQAVDLATDLARYCSLAGVLQVLPASSTAAGVPFDVWVAAIAEIDSCMRWND